jgi:uncharacterized protein YicC (UPF0701 family)
MTKLTPEGWEIAIGLPLGVVAEQLMRIESQLRALNIKALNLGREQEGSRAGGKLEARLEHINAALDSIKSLMSEIDADVAQAGTVARKRHSDLDD